jgi:glycosyltransferase involved in cell wall biosynthesis
MNRVKVFLTGGDDIGWAIDEDRKLTSIALEGLVETVGFEDCDVVHSLWWERLFDLPPNLLIGKRIICHVPGEPFRYLGVPSHSKAIPLVGCWITRTLQAEYQLKSVGISSRVVPYLIDTDIFKPLPKDLDEIVRIHEKWNIPKGVYLIGSFQRDSEGLNLSTPKLVKGPDIFLEILLRLKRSGIRFHVILAGPRRHWLRMKMAEHELPFTYLGESLEHDDISFNSRSRSDLNLIYNFLDLYIVSSRSEGGPHSILEAAGAKCKVISTRVGMAPDVLPGTSLYGTPKEAADLIIDDVEHNTLEAAVDMNYRKVQESHRPESVRSLFLDIYNNINAVEVVAEQSFSPSIRLGRTHELNRYNQEGISLSNIKVGLWHSFFKPPYGGGNQFMMALRKALLRKNVEVVENELDQAIDAYVLNSIHFDVDRFLEFSKHNKLNVIHRIDGPIHLIRGFDREKDELCFNLNQRFAGATVLQSAWTYQRIVEMGYMPVNTTIIHNAVDMDVFNAEGRIPFSKKRKIRLISTSWSNNPRKGGPTYKWIEKNLDWDSFEYTFVGNVSESFERIRHIPPVPSGELARILRNHDIYITASRNDPCSNAVIEALSCGLPVLYYNDGGHPELVGYGGLPFNNEEEIFDQLSRLVDGYESFQRLITVSKLDDVADKYLAMIKGLLG